MAPGRFPTDPIRFDLWKVRMPGPCAVIFDLDGVVVDTEPVWERARRGFVAEQGGRWPAEAQRRLMGMSTPEWAAYLADEAGVGLPPEEVAGEVIDRMARSYASSLPLIPGAADAVRRI